MGTRIKQFDLKKTEVRILKLGIARLVSSTLAIAKGSTDYVG